ncbi:peptidoglycan-binding protein [Paracoccus sp. MBLB3053]|uniref:Peptidoglycan-binding protein n=1 Tax=Paracoccus aurantius TaxID=3073814 RepID=A0ABU2HPA3_9RHOB|nr:peptidoglycan-binding protein [Paracoccus sp. MBLB3053]MDS9466874.1 peptidoglycan-binding protein [Paracoccus sp. MBLB3053]
MRYPLFLLAALAGAAPALAESRAVVIGNADYLTAPDLAGSDTDTLARIMREAGFVTAQGIDQPTAELRRSLDLLARNDDAPGGRIVSLSGRFLHDAEETWFLGTEASKPGPEDLPAMGVPLSLILQTMSGAKPGAILLLGSDRQEMPHQGDLANGIGDLAQVEGVTVVFGAPEATAQALRELAAGHNLGRALAAGDGLKLLTAGEMNLAPAKRRPRTSLKPADLAESERQAWAVAVATDSPVGYADYLRRFPTGAFSRAALDRMEFHTRKLLPAETAPPGNDIAAESGLGLNRSDRRTIQLLLAKLGHDPGELDGYFGPRTRRSLGEWQSESGLPVTGHLSASQLALMQQQNVTAEGRTPTDQPFWKKLGEKGAESKLWVYLRGGRPATEPAPKPAPILNGEPAVWRWARRQDTWAGYDLYLGRFPDGEHASEARLRRDNMRAANEAARREELALGLTPAMRMQIETRLKLSGWEVGQADGEFGEETREALRLYQASRNLRVTGYLSSQTISSLMADVPDDSDRFEDRK